MNDTRLLRIALFFATLIGTLYFPTFESYRLLLMMGLRYSSTERWLSRNLRHCELMPELMRVSKCWYRTMLAIKKTRAFVFVLWLQKKTPNLSARQH